MIDKGTKNKTGWNLLLSLLLTAALFAVAALLYRFTYGVIDDPFITTVLNGAYTGTPDAHVVYIKYPLAWIFMTLFRIIPSVNWHFLYLTGCFAVCIFAVNYRICSNVKKILPKIIFCILFMLLFWLCMAKMILTAHYSMCAATLAATGLFCFGTIRPDCSKGARVLNIFFVLLLLWNAYALRARTLFMLLPLGGVLFLYQFFREKPYFSFRNLVRWLSIPILLFIGLGTIELVHNAQYRDKAWQEFLSFNDARTTLYDFYGLPEYEKNKDFYQSLNISGAREYMYEKYYLEFQDNVPEDALSRIADHRVEEYKQDMPTGKRIVETLKALFPNLALKTYLPVSWICGAAFFIFLLIALIMAKWRLVWTLVLGIIASLIPWLWMIYMGKPTSRVTMGIWAADLLFLAALLISNSDRIKEWVEEKSVLCYILSVIVAALLVFGIVRGYGKIASAQEKTISSGLARSSLENYCESHPENLYICESEIVNGLGFDVRAVDNSLQNLYWPGGWTAKMAQSKEIWARFGISDIEKAAAQDDNVYIVAFEETDMDYWTDFYREQYPGIVLKETERIECDQIPFKVYQLQER